jgi:hypothetical protein
VTSAIDRANDGTLTLHFDVPAQHVMLADDVRVEVTSLVTTVSFAHATCGGGGGSSWGFWDI